MPEARLASSELFILVGPHSGVGFSRHLGNGNCRRCYPGVGVMRTVLRSHGSWWQSCIHRLGVHALAAMIRTSQLQGSSQDGPGEDAAWNSTPPVRGEG